MRCFRPFLLLVLISSLLSHAFSSRSFPLKLKEHKDVLPHFKQAENLQNGPQCATDSDHLYDSFKSSSFICDPSLVHVAMTLDRDYLRGSIAAIHSVLKHTSCPQNVYFHFIASDSNSPYPNQLAGIIKSTFPSLSFEVRPFSENRVKRLISSSIRQALDNPLNYARIYLADMIEPCITRVIYLDSDTILVDDIKKLWSIKLADSRVIGAPEYCNVDFTRYFTDEFWRDRQLPKVFEAKRPCYYNTGVMIMDLARWREGDYTKKIENWMEIQRVKRIYELGSLPPFLLVFGGNIEGIDHRWNQHGLGGDNVMHSCRSVHPGPVSLLHWSGKGKPWVRLDEGRACPVDHLWAPYDLYTGNGPSKW